MTQLSLHSQEECSEKSRTGSRHRNGKKTNLFRLLYVGFLDLQLPFYSRYFSLLYLCSFYNLLAMIRKQIHLEEMKKLQRD